MKPIITINSAKFRYSGSPTEFCFPHFVINSGQTISIIGRSGHGKTTLIKVLLGLVGIESGVVNPLDLTAQGRVGFVAQETFLLPWLSGADNILLPLSLSGKRGASNMTASVMEETLSGLAKIMGIQKHLNKYPHEMSGGIRRRTELARAMMLEPDVLVLDEPFSGLDVDIRDSIFESLTRYQTANSTGIIFVTHDLHDAAMISDLVYYFAHEGRLAPRPLEIDQPTAKVRGRYELETLAIARKIAETVFSENEH